MPEPAWQEDAGSLLLLAAAHATGLVEALDAALPLACPTCPARLAHSTHASRERLLLTLLFLNAVGVRRTWELRSYTGTGLALLSRRQGRTVIGIPSGFSHKWRVLVETNP